MMGLFLVEAALNGIVNSKEELYQKASELQEVLSSKEAALIELQVSKDFSRSFFIVEANEEEIASSVLKEAGIPIDLVKEVRLVGDELEKSKTTKRYRQLFG